MRSRPLNVPVPLPANGLSLLATFDDITRPETMRTVDPETLQAVLGKGVLGWMRYNPGGALIPRGDLMGFSLPAILRRDQFIQRNGAL